MKKIVPFNKILRFNNNISEINSISLEHKISDMGDSLSGEFIILGDYTVDETKNKEEFNFKLPFDVALGVNYNKDNMVVDIDDFRYQLISSKEVEVNIDLYIDGEIIPDKSTVEDDLEENNNIDELEEKNRDMKLEDDILDDVIVNNDNININNNDNENIDIPHMNIFDNIDNENIDIPHMNIFDNIDNGDGYATYRIYTVMPEDTIDTILNKYNITLEELSKYNDTSNLKANDKLIIPSDEK